MKIIICDVGDAACAFVTSPKGYTMMIDCGSSDNKDNPVDTFKRNKNWLGSIDYVTRYNRSYQIALLHITHPDDDHVRNANKVIAEIPPYLLHRTRYELFSDGEDVNTDYKEKIDKQYRGDNTESIPWGFDINETFRIMPSMCRNNDYLKEKERNNSSIVRYINADGVGILFCGDLETPGWEYLVNNDSHFVNLVKTNGVNILIAPHHGHKSGFPKALFNIIGEVDCVIHSKDTEASKEGTDISTQYYSKSKGVPYKALSDNNIYYGRVLTTRSNGNIFISTVRNGSYTIYTDKASSNHKQIN